MQHWTAVKGIDPQPAPWNGYDRESLERMLAAGREVTECYRVLDKGGINTVGEVLKGGGKFYQDDHYPEGDVFDEETGSQYYYHAHRGIPGEHGHFHTFLRADAIPGGVRPVPHDTGEPWPEGEDTIIHLGAVSMDPSGFPLGFFMTNRWVTGEAWFSAGDIIGLLARFEIDHAMPSWATNRWITGLLALFHPQLAGLLRHRDRVVGAWAEQHPGQDVFEDRDLDLTGWMRISVEEQIATIERAIG